MNPVNINFERPQFSKEDSARNMEVVNRWISDSAEKLNMLVSILQNEETHADATGDSIGEATMNFTSSDVADGSAAEWTSVPALSSGEKHNAILGKVSQMFKNVRYLFKILGTTDISGIGDGTATGAISSLNADLAKQETAVDSNASQISSNTSAISTLNSDLANLKFGVDSDGNYGYIKPGADTVIPFKDLTWGTPFKTHLNIPSDFFVSVTISFPKPPKIIIVPIPGQENTHYPSWFATVDLTNQQTTYPLKSSTGWNKSGSGYSCDADVYWAY